MASVSGFDEWFGASADDPGCVAWHRAVFDACGPVDDDVVGVLWLEAQVEATESAVALMMVDLSVVSQVLPEIEVDAFEAVRVTCDGALRQPAVQSAPWRHSEIAVEIIQTIQSLSQFDDWVTWPMCLDHDLDALCPAVHNDVAWWRCRAGDHMVAPVGDLINGISQRALPNDERR